MKRNRGITLIALAVTIIVLLILAGISVATLNGENGLIANAIKAKEKSEIDGEKELIETATIQAMEKDKYGNISVDGLQQELEDNATVEKIRKKIVVTINDSQRMYYVDDNGNVFEYEYFDLAVMEDGINFCNRMADYKESILTITVLDNMDIPENVYRVFDVSKKQDETVKAWLVENVENTDMYDLYIGGKEGVESKNCDQIFAYYSNCVSIDVSNLYTEDVTNFCGMFTWDTKLQTINLSNIDTSSAIDMNSMFNKCTSLTKIDVSNFNTSNVTNMSGMFYQCAFTEIDLSSFDTSSLQRTDYMFYNCGPTLKKIYVSDKWNNNKVTQSNWMFLKCEGLSGKISYDSTKVDITYANYENGYFIYKTNE